MIHMIGSSHGDDDDDDDDDDETTALALPASKDQRL